MSDRAGIETRSRESGTFRFRMGTAADIPVCEKLIPPGFRPPKPVRRRLPEVWRLIVDSDAKVFAIVEDIESEFPHNIEAFGLNVFTNDRFVDEFCAAPRAYVAALFYERLLAGDDVLPTREQLAHANAGSNVNVLVLHFGLREPDLSQERSARALLAASGAFYFFHGGFRIKRMIGEFYGKQELEYVTAGGFRLTHDFSREQPDRFSGIPAEHRPYLFMQRREWIAPAAANPLSQLFHTPAPRIQFSNKERYILERALLNQSDEEIAAAMRVTVNAVKQTWRNIFDRVARRAPQVMPSNDLEQSGRRGVEKRRHLLDYLRAHLEELRPYRAR